MSDTRPPSSGPGGPDDRTRPFAPGELTPPARQPASPVAPPGGAPRYQAHPVPSQTGGLPPVGGASPPSSSRAALAIAAAALVVLLLVGAFLFLRPPGAPGSAAGSPTATAAVSAPPAASGATADPTAPAPSSETPPAETPAGSSGGTPTVSPPASDPPVSSPEPGETGPPASMDPAVAAAIAEITAQVPPIRGLEPQRDVPNTFISHDAFAADLRRMFEEENPPERVEAEEAVLERLGLLAPDADLRSLFLDLYTSQVLAFYRPDTGTFYIVDRDAASDELTPLDRVTVAHEYTHALQDQHFGLEELHEVDEAEGDRAIAQLALPEGDATLLMFQWATQHLSLAEQLEIFAGSLAPGDQELLDRMPPILRRQLEFPYTDGFFLAFGLHSSGGFAAIDAAFADPPTTTEQVLHPEKYAAREPAVAVPLLDVTEALGAGWTLSSEQTMGEMQTQVWVADGATAPPPVPGSLPVQPGAEAAAGWGGDRLGSYDGPDGRWAVVWTTAWDTEADADEFTAAAEAAMGDLAGSHGIVVDTCVQPGEAPRQVVVIASDDETFAVLRESIAARAC